MDIEWALTGGSPFTHKLRRKLLRVWVAPVGPDVDWSWALNACRPLHRQGVFLAVAAVAA
jgi:hypothetical protein